MSWEPLFWKFPEYRAKCVVWDFIMLKDLLLPENNPSREKKHLLHYLHYLGKGYTWNWSWVGIFFLKLESWYFLCNFLVSIDIWSDFRSAFPISPPSRKGFRKGINIKQKKTEGTGPSSSNLGFLSVAIFINGLWWHLGLGGSSVTLGSELNLFKLQWTQQLNGNNSWHV